MASPDYSDAVKEMIIKRLNEVGELIAKEHKGPEESVWVIQVAHENVATVGPSSNEPSKLDGSSNVELEDCTREAKDSNHNLIENAEKSPEALECPEQIVGPSSNEAASKLDGSSNVELEDCTLETKGSNNHGVEEVQKSRGHLHALSRLSRLK